MNSNSPTPEELRHNPMLQGNSRVCVCGRAEHDPVHTGHAVPADPLPQWRCTPITAAVARIWSTSSTTAMVLAWIASLDGAALPTAAV